MYLKAFLIDNMPFFIDEKKDSSCLCFNPAGIMRFGSAYKLKIKGNAGLGKNPRQ